MSERIADTILCATVLIVVEFLFVAIGYVTTNTAIAGVVFGTVFYWIGWGVGAAR